MSEKRPSRKTRRPEPDFIDKSELAIHFGCSTRTLEDWIELNQFPPPHSRPGQRHAIWLRAHYEAYRQNRRWPKEAYHSSSSMDSSDS